MPKIIKDLDKKIIETSLALFEKRPYQKVNVRTIAEEVGIAVGTLYNYYPTKWELYMSVFEESWNKTYIKLREETENLEQDYIKVFFTTLYYEIKKKKGIVGEIFRYIDNEDNIDKSKKKKTFEKIKFPDVIENQIYDLFLENLRKKYNIEVGKIEPELDRLFTIIQTSIPLLYNVYKNEDKRNIEFIYNIIDAYIKENNKNIHCI